MKSSLIALGATVYLAANAVAANEFSISTGLAEETNSGLIDCGSGTRPSKVGSIASEDGKRWVVPAQTNYTTTPRAFDLYNECDNVTPNKLSDVDLDAVPVLDADGSEVFTAFIFADNYFEFYVNGKLIAVDAVPFTPFNSSIVKFKTTRPATIAIMGVDWEENLGLGSEAGRGKKFQPGDAGVVAIIMDEQNEVVSVTDNSWHAQTFYTSPISDRTCIVENASLRDSSACSTNGSNSADGLSAAFWPIPDGWETPAFDASAWPSAYTFTNDTVGVDNKPAYTNFTELFDGDIDAQFIWSSNLVLDNLVLMRTEIK